MKTTVCIDGKTIRCCVYGIILILLLTFGIWLRTSTVSHVHMLPPPSPSSSLSSSPLPPAYCTSSSIHANCLFSRSLCYNINSAVWETSSLPFSNWSGVSLRSRGALPREASDDSKCNDPFLPKLYSTPADNNIYWINGTNVISCLWVTVFGHILLEMMLPAWMSMRTLADQLPFSDQNITYIMDDRRGVPLGPPSFSLLSHQPVLHFRNLVNEGKQRGKSHVCFERLIVGYRLQSPLEYAHNVAHLQNGDLARFRDYVKTLHGLPLTVNMSAGACVVLFVQRGSDRRIIPESVKVVAEILRERTLCTVKEASFDGISIVEQVRLVASATIFVSVSGSGAQQFIWLPDGAASLIIIHPQQPLNVITREPLVGHGGLGGGGLILNDFLCWRHPTILCLTAGAKGINPHRDGRNPIEVDTSSLSNALDMIKLFQRRGKFDPRDPSE
jgi:hypothetical protein